MTRAEFESLACVIACRDNDQIIFGAYCVFDQFTSIPHEIEAWFEIDMFPRGRPAQARTFTDAWLLSEDVEMALQPETDPGGTVDDGPKERDLRALPEGWWDRLNVREVNTEVGLLKWSSLEVHDWTIGRLLVGAKHDHDLIRHLLRNGMLEERRLRELILRVAGGSAVWEAATIRLDSILDELTAIPIPAPSRGRAAPRDGDYNSAGFSIN